MRDCPICLTQFEERSRQHNYCGLDCWIAAGGMDLRDVSDLKRRQCIHCHTPFMPLNRLQRYCGPDCFNSARESAMQRYLMTYIDDVGRINATKDACRQIALGQGFSEDQFNWFWAEHTYIDKDDRLRLEDLPVT